MASLNECVDALSELKINADIFISEKPEEYAIVLIDTSASTKLKFSSGKPVLSDGFEDSVFGKQCDILKSLPHKFFYILFWSSVQPNGRFDKGYRLIPGPVKKDSMELLFKVEFYQIKDTYLTNTALAFEHLPQEWLNATKKVYLLTDGEIGGGNIDPNVVKQSLSELLHKLKDILALSIFTVERTERDFANTNEVSNIAGSDVFNTIQNKNLTSLVDNFTSHYPSNGATLKFPHISKRKAPVGYIPYGDQYFLEINMHKFMQYIADELKNANESDQLVIAQKLVVTLSVLLKDKTPAMIESNLRTFSKLFTIDSQVIYYIIGDSLLAEQSGRAKIIANYRNILSNLYKNAQSKLMENVSSAIGMGEHFYSYPISNDGVMHILSGPRKLVSNDFITKAGRFPKSCVSKTPVFGFGSTEFNNQCLRQWTRVVYSKRFSVKAADDLIIYLVLAETLAICNSQIDISTRNVYQQLSKVMLDKKRSNVEKTELQYLMEGNLPTSNSGSFEEFISLLEHAATLLGIVTPNGIILWNHIVNLMNEVAPGLYDAQKTHIQMHPNFRNFALEYPKYTQDALSVSSVYDYVCYITLEDLTKTGGYIFRTHKSPTGVDCCPSFMISKSAMTELKSKGLSCPVCYAQLSINNYDEAPVYLETKLPSLYTTESKTAESKVAEIEGDEGNYLIIMRGVVGAGKSTFSEYIKNKYTALGYKVVCEGTDKYCSKGIAANKAVKFVQRELFKVNNTKSRTIVIIDTCGEKYNSQPFGVDFSKWKTIEFWPNWSDSSSKMGYLAWTLTNVLNRDVVTNDSPYYLTPHAKANRNEGIQLCKDVHKKKAMSLGLYDHAFAKLSDADRIALATEYAKTIKPCEFTLPE